MITTSYGSEGAPSKTTTFLTPPLTQFYLKHFCYMLDLYYMYVRPLYVLTYLGSIDRVHLRWAPMLISDLIMGILGKYLIQKTIKCFASQEIEKKRIFCC